MALIGNSILGEMGGSLGNTSIVKTRYSKYIKRKSRPTNRRTQRQKTSKNRYRSVYYMWAKLTPAQHQQWLKFASTFIHVDKEGNEFEKRAYDLFRTINRNLIEINEPTTLIPPKKVYPDPIESFSVKITASKELEDIKVFLDTPVPQNTKVIIYASPEMGLGQNSTKKSFYKKVKVIDSTFLSGTSILNEYLALNILCPPHTFKFAFKFRAVSTISGLSEAPFSFIERAF